MRTLITNGLVVTAAGSYPADVLVDGETIALLGSGLAGAGITADETIDATGKYVVPGGIDVHTHMELPFGGTVAKDTFESGSKAAAHGGTTTILDFAAQTKGRPLREGLDAWRAKAEGHTAIDYGFHMMMTDVNDATLAEMDQLIAEGVPEFKLFTAYPGVNFSPDDHIFRAMQRTRENGGLVMMHAENGLVIDVIAADLVAAGITGPIGHGLARYAILEGEATNRVIRLAEAAGVPVYVVNLSSRDALEAVTAARGRGVQHRGGDRVRAEGEASDRVVVEVGGEVEHDATDVGRGGAVEGHAAEVDVVVGLLAAREHDPAVDHGLVEDVLAELGTVVGSRHVEQRSRGRVEDRTCGRLDP